MQLLVVAVCVSYLTKLFIILKIDISLNIVPPWEFGSEFQCEWLLISYFAFVCEKTYRDKGNCQQPYAKKSSVT